MQKSALDQAVEIVMQRAHADNPHALADMHAKHLLDCKIAAYSQCVKDLRAFVIVLHERVRAIRQVNPAAAEILVKHVDAFAENVETLHLATLNLQIKASHLANPAPHWYEAGEQAA